MRNFIKLLFNFNKSYNFGSRFKLDGIIYFSDLERYETLTFVNISGKERINTNYKFKGYKNNTIKYWQLYFSGFKDPINQYFPYH